MTLLQSMEGKYYDVPDEKAASFELPREKVQELMSKAGPPATQGAPSSGQRPGGPSGPPPTGGSPVIIQVLPNGIHGPAQQGGPPPDGKGEVDPYWVYYQWWTNWSNWGNYW